MSNYTGASFNKQPHEDREQREPSRTEAERFLAALGLNSEELTFHLGPGHEGDTDRRHRGKPKGKFAQVWPRLQRLAREGAYVGAVLAPKRSDGQATGPRVLSLDLDSDLPPDWPAGLPHALVETSPGRYHAHILLGPCTDDQLAALQRALIGRTGADPSAAGIGRSWRLPGTIHAKDPARPHLVQVIQGKTAQPIEVQELAQHLGIDLNAPLRAQRPSSDHQVRAKGPVPKGRRKHFLVQEAGHLRLDGFTDTQIHQELATMNVTQCDPPLPSQEVEDVVRSAQRWDRPATDERPTIPVRGSELPTIVDRAEDALLTLDDCDVFQRGDILVRPASDGSQTRRLGVPAMVDRFTRAARFVKFDARSGGWRAIDCPKQVAEVYLERSGSWRVPSLRAILRAPTVRSDGTILASPGYDPDSELLVRLDGDWPEIPQHPTREDAEAALSDLRAIVASFPFEADCDEAAAIAALITPLVRPALPAAPLLAVTAPTAGTGKSKLVDIAATFATDDLPNLITANSETSEMEKRLGAALMSGKAVLSIDNVETPLRSELLCQALTQGTVDIRRLGVSELVNTPTTATFYATGNNLRIAGDLSRRTVLVRLDAEVERPELRRFDRDALAVAREQRQQLASAALTIVRAHYLAGLPGAESLSAFGSFERWSAWVRGALVWLGMADPLGAAETVRAEDPYLAELRELLHAIRSVFGDRKFTVKELAEEALLIEDLGDLVDSVAAEGRRYNTRKLGNYLSKHRGRLIDGLRIERAGKYKGALVYRVADVNGTGPGAKERASQSQAGEFGESSESCPKGGREVSDDKSQRRSGTNSQNSQTHQQRRVNLYDTVL